MRGSRQFSGSRVSTLSRTSQLVVANCLLVGSEVDNLVVPRQHGVAIFASSGSRRETK